MGPTPAVRLGTKAKFRGGFRDRYKFYRSPRTGARCKTSTVQYCRSPGDLGEVQRKHFMELPLPYRPKHLSPPIGRPVLRPIVHGWTKAKGPSP